MKCPECGKPMKFVNVRKLTPKHDLKANGYVVLLSRCYQCLEYHPNKEVFEK